MADIKKFLDQSGVSTLWGVIASELEKKAAADDVYTKTEVDNKIAAIPTYDDTALAGRVKVNEEAIAVLEGDSSVEGSVAYQIAAIVAGADASYDTLKEISDWIASHPDQVAALNTSIKANSDAIAALELLVGDKAVATQITEALADYVTTASLNTTLADYVKSADVAEVHAQVATNKTNISSNATAITNLTSRLDGIVAQGGEPNVINTIKVNGVTQAIAEDKSVDIAVPVVEALTEAEIKTACGITE